MMKLRLSDLPSAVLETVTWPAGRSATMPEKKS